ncbi:hypothetical protein Cni_G16180 [Canna indica]|uniref:3'-5' exonuclease n=1 Tax=Canna indica TaxID=4628 RepID=A0AAQ3QDZ2_9LILI|nr:hypothetical protein Cni_G16180 [Canna indica]
MRRILAPPPRDQGAAVCLAGLRATPPHPTSVALDVQVRRGPTIGIRHLALQMRLGVSRLFGAQAAGNFKVKYPTMVFRGSIIYCRTALEVERASMELLDKIRSMKQNMNHVSLGFDIEWKPIFKRGHAQRKAAVMQICLDKATCYVMHIIHSGIPPVLKSLLEDDISIKVGVCIAGDACKIIKDYNVSVEPLDDLSSLANLKLGGAPKKWSLASLTEMITCKQLAKPNRIRLGNWEADVLSKEQLQYAATDAFVSWYLYEALKGYPDAIIETKDMYKAENVMNEHQKQTQSLR